jgi:hypothetical protein
MAESIREKGNVAAYDLNGAGTGADLLTSGISSREAYDEILHLHREHAPAKDLYFLDHLSFPLNETSDRLRVRFLLWQPVALFLQYGFYVEIMEHMCGGHVVVANLEHDAAAVAGRIIPPIEATRRKEPEWMIYSGPQVLLHVLAEVADEPFLNPATAEKMHRMLREFKSAVRRGDYSGLSALRAQLSELAAVSTESDVRSCIEYLYLRASDDAHSWPPHSAALASEQALAREWLTPEEDAAWSYL